MLSLKYFELRLFEAFKRNNSQSRLAWKSILLWIIKAAISSWSICEYSEEYSSLTLGKMCNLMLTHFMKHPIWKINWFLLQHETSLQNENLFQLYFCSSAISLDSKSYIALFCFVFIVASFPLSFCPWGLQEWMTLFYPTDELIIWRDSFQKETELLYLII